MSLATRCTACGTVFRIVEDQLRVSDGWVRCGRCAEIFDARELLFDIERDAPPPWPASFASEQVAEAPSPPPSAPLPSPPPAQSSPEPPPASSSPRPEWEPLHDPEPRIDGLPTGWPAEVARQEPQWVDVDETTGTPSWRGSASEPPPPMTAEPSSAPPAVVPEFMRRSRRSAHWDRPRVRRALILASVLLAALLAIQMVMHFRDALAALHPPLRPALQGICRAVGCEIKPWRRIDALSIESTSLNPVGGGYRLTLSLRNKTGVDVAPPWVELSLTDVTGAPFARRVIAPQALTPQASQITSESDQALTFSFTTGGQQVSGYSVNVFYP